MQRFLFLTLLLSSCIPVHAADHIELLTDYEMRETQGSGAISDILYMMIDGFKQDLRKGAPHSWVWQARTAESSALSKLEKVAAEASQLTSIHGLTRESAYFLGSKQVPQEVYRQAREQFINGMRYRLDIGDVIVNEIRRYYARQRFLKRDLQNMIEDVRTSVLRQHRVASLDELPKAAQEKLYKFEMDANMSWHTQARKERQVFVKRFLKDQYGIQVSSAKPNRFPDISREVYGHDIHEIQAFLKDKYNLQLDPSQLIPSKTQSITSTPQPNQVMRQIEQF